MLFPFCFAFLFFLPLFAIGIIVHEAWGSTARELNAAAATGCS
jgi:hypothetical protein